MTQNVHQTFKDAAGKPLSLVLYKFDSCPFCRKVQRRAAELGLEIPQRDTLLDNAARTELMRTGGKTQVPCLFINGRPLYESDDIITFLENQVHVA